MLINGVCVPLVLSFLIATTSGQLQQVPPGVVADVVDFVACNSDDSVTVVSAPNGNHTSGASPQSLSLARQMLLLDRLITVRALDWGSVQDRDFDEGFMEKYAKADFNVVLMDLATGEGVDEISGRTAGDYYYRGT